MEHLDCIRAVMAAHRLVESVSMHSVLKRYKTDNLQGLGAESALIYARDYLSELAAVMGYQITPIDAAPDVDVA